MTIPDPTTPFTDERGYKYVETSDDWKKLCSALPCFAAMHWPDYDTAVVYDVIDGQEVIIQLWKGWCQQFLGSANWPGGIGAEVGIYRRIPGKDLPADLSFVPPVLREMLKLADTLDEKDLWWPWPELETTISFELFNPATEQLFFYAGPEKTYWRNRWMSLDSYNDCRRDQGGLLPNMSTGFRLDYVINGKKYSW